MQRNVSVHACMHMAYYLFCLIVCLSVRFGDFGLQTADCGEISPADADADAKIETRERDFCGAARCGVCSSD